MTFDFKAAWNGLARPEFEALDARAKYLFLEVAEKCADSGQDDDLLLPWADVELRANFEALPRPILAYAARVTYFYGHWSPERHASIGSGAYWKFANLADQSLRGGLGLPRTTSEEHGVSLRVHDGFLRVCVSTPNAWTWRELGLATIANQSVWAMEPEPAMPHPNTSDPRVWEVYDRAAASYIGECAEALAAKATPAVLRWLTVTATYTEA